MLYVNTNNKNLTYTAFQALKADFEPADGMIAPLRLPAFSKKDLNTIYSSGVSGAISFVLNKFFYSKISAADVEAIVHKQLFSAKELDRRTILVGLNKDYFKFEQAVFKLLCSEECTPSVWSKCTIRISLIAAMFGELRRNGTRKMDFAVNSDDICSIIPVLYCKIMGLPIDNIVIGASCEDGIWKYLHKSPAASTAAFSYFLHGLSFVEDHMRFTEDLFPYIVSAARAEEIAANMKHVHGSTVTLSAAFSYGAIQGYRAITGENRTAIVFNA